MQLGIQGIALYGKFSVTGNIRLPGQGIDPLKQRFKIPGREGTQLHQHPGAAAEIDIQPGNVRRGAVAVHPAVFRPDIVQIQAAHFLRHQTFQTKQAGNRQNHGPCLLSNHQKWETAERSPAVSLPVPV